MKDLSLFGWADSHTNQKPTVSQPAAKEEIVSKKPRPIGEVSGSDAKFPLDALGKVGSEIARLLQDKYQAPMALCAQSVLCAMSTSVSSWGQVRNIYGSSTPLSLYLITVAQSGERKTAVDDEVQLGIKVYEKEVAQKLTCANMEAATVDDDGLSAGAKIRVTDPTFEGLLKVMKKGVGFACLSNDDAASWLGGYSMSAEQKQKTTAGLSQIWSGTDVCSPRADGRDAGVSGVPLSLSLMFQPYLISQVFGDREMVEQGFLARVLPTFPATTMGTRFFKECAAETEQRLKAFAGTIFQTIEHSQSQKAHQSATSKNDRFTPDFAVLNLSKGAKKILISFHDEIETQLAPGGELAKIRGFASRATENATRLAGIISLFDNMAQTEVTKSAAMGACELMRFYLQEFSFLVAIAKTEKDVSSAVLLGIWMKNKYGAGGLGYDKDISQFGPMGLRKKGQRQEALRLLYEARWIEPLPKNTVVDGAQRQEAFRVNAQICDVL